MKPFTHSELTPSGTRLIAAFAAIYLIWGSTYLAVRFTVEAFPPFLAAGTRAFLAGGILFSLVGATRIRALTLGHWGGALLSGGLLFLGGHGLLFKVQQRMDSGVAAIILATLPGWIAVMSRLAGQSVLTSRTVTYLLLGLSGVAVLAIPSTTLNAPVCDPSSAAILLVGAVSWAGGSVIGRSRRLPIHTGTATAMQLLCGGALSILCGLIIGEAAEVEPAGMSTRSIVAFAYLVVFGSLVSFSAYSWLMRVADPAKVGTYAFINPIVAVILGWVIADEPVTLTTAAACAIVIASVVLIHRNRQRAVGRESKQFIPKKSRSDTQATENGSRNATYGRKDSRRATVGVTAEICGDSN